MASIPRVDASDIPSAIVALEKSGVVILSNFTTSDLVDKANADLKGQLKDVLEQPIDFFPGRVQTCYSAFCKSETVRENWTLNPSYQSIVDHFLTTESVPWQGEKVEKIVGRPILSTSLSVNILPGAKAQLLHRDDMAWQQHLPDRSGGYKPDLELCVGLFVPGTKFYKENGGTLVVPGSHVWPHERRAKLDETVCCVMDKGDALIALGSVGHGAGSNVTNTERILHTIIMCRAWLKPENTIFPIVTLEDVKKWSPDAQRIGGYTRGELFIGHTEGRGPIDVMMARAALK